MKDSLRKKWAKAISNGSDEASQASETTANPWANEATKETSPDLPKQALKPSKSQDGSRVSTDTVVGSRIVETVVNPPRLEATDEIADDNQTSTKGTRRRKTITKTDGTFELEDDLEPVANNGLSSEPAGSPPRSLAAGVAVPLSFSNVTTILDQPPIERIVSAPRKATNPFTVSHNRKPSIQPNGAISSTLSNPCRFTPPPLDVESFTGKVVVLTNGASPVGQSLVRKLHSAGSRVIFGDAHTDKARRFISSLGPPHVIHFNPCDVRKYHDILGLFKLAVSMYGRVDHAIFGVADDGGQAGSVGDGEKGWFDQSNQVAKSAIEEVQTEQPGKVEDTISASARFARIAIAYLKHTPHQAKKEMPKRSFEDTNPSIGMRATDRSLTFITSVAAFKHMPGLPVYQAAQHVIFGLVRSLSASFNAETDGVRINAIATNMMIARIDAQVGGRMSVSIPPDNPEDVGRIVAGVIAGTPEGSGESVKQGIWYEDSEARFGERYLHGRLLYMVGGECWDVQEGLDRSEQVWLGTKPREALANALDGVGNGRQWILDIQ